MESLFKVNFPWFAYILVIIVIRVLWVDLSFVGFIALCIVIHQFLLLFYSIGSVVPIRYIAGAFMCLQMLLGPTFAYNGLDKYQYITYKMKIPEMEYFGYALPAVILFIVGLHISAGKLKGEVLNQKAIQTFVDHAGNLPFIFIGIGFLASVVSIFFSTNLGFVFTLLASFKFIGAFMLIYGGKQLKNSVLIMVFGSIVVSSLQKAMFHDLLTWLIMIGAVVAIKYKPNIRIKAVVAVAFILMAVIIQQLKGDYRKAAWGRGESGIETFNELYNEKQEQKGIFNFEKLAESNVRINQGFIITNIMNTVPEKEPFSNGGELYLILEAAFLPRVLAPDKLKAGDRSIFMKYSKIPLRRGTSMGLSSMGDAYINFGILGGCLFMFCLGLLFSHVLNVFDKQSKIYPVLLLFTPLVFYYPMRPDCELQTSLGHLVKSCFLIFVMLKLWDYQFRTRKKNAVPEQVLV